MTVIIKPKLTQPCKLWTGSARKDGYGYCRRDGKQELAHRVVYAEAHGLSMDDIADVVIRHQCDTPGCVEPEHLIPGTQTDNRRDCVQRGRSRGARGEASGKAKLTEDQVRTIRQRIANGKQCKLIALEFGVDPRTISCIKHRKNWAWLINGGSSGDA